MLSSHNRRYRRSQEHKDIVDRFLEELRLAKSSSNEGTEEFFGPPISPTPVGAATNPSPDKILDY